jgi:hypothetical protein
MDLSGLAKLGKIGGITGIGLGMAVLLFGDILKGIGVLPENWRGPVVVLIILIAVALAGGALAGWLLRQRRAACQKI